MERTEIVSLYKNTPADGTMVTVCGWAKNIRDSKNIGFIALSDGGTAACALWAASCSPRRPSSPLS